MLSALLRFSKATKAFPLNSQTCSWAEAGMKVVHQEGLQEPQQAC